MAGLSQETVQRRGGGDFYAEPSGAVLSGSGVDDMGDEDTCLINAMEIEQPGNFDAKRDRFPPWLFGHPRGLFVLAATEVWERFGFYGMRSLLILYLTQELLLPPRKDEVWGCPCLIGLGTFRLRFPRAEYMAFTHGGLLADRYLGRQRTVMLGAALMSLGYLLLATWPAAFLPTLVIIACGSGALKPNVSSQIGLMYDSADPRRSAAFLIFYCAINLGAFLSPLVSGVLHATLGFRAGFFASSVAVFLGLIQYVAGLSHLPPDRLLGVVAAISRGSDDGAAGRPIASSSTPPPPSLTKLMQQHRTRLLAILAVCMLTVGFWGVYEQQGNTLPLFADQEVEMHFFGARVPTEFVQSINPLFIIAFTPLLSSLWKWQAQRDGEPGSLTKMGLGCLLLACSYLNLTASAWLANLAGAKVGFFQLAASIALATVAELYLAPVGLAFVSKTAPEELTAFVMGIWFIASSIGFYLCGSLGTLYSSLPLTAFFGLMAAIAGVNGLAMLLARPYLRKQLLAP